MIINMTIVAPTAKVLEVLNIDASISSPLFSFGKIIPNANITATQIKNTQPILSKKGTVLQSAPSSQLLCIDRAIKKPPTIAKNAPAELVLFQKKPIMKAAKMPGESKPVIS